MRVTAIFALLALLNAQNASGVASETYEMQFALNELLDYYLEINPGITLARANREAFAKWLEKFYQPGEAEQGIIRLTTPHAGKGLEADDVYLINPSLFPMADKIEQGARRRLRNCASSTWPRRAPRTAWCSFRTSR